MAIEASVGTRVGDYILVRKLGEGGMAEVWLARQHASANFRALKFLNAQFQGIPEVEARFQNEGENQLVHPNIVRIYEVGQHAGSSFIAMDYIDGRDLEKVMDSRRGPLTVPEAVDIGSQILAGLGFAHTNGIVHRDIKPSNVLVDSDGQAYLMDFGIAKALRTGRNMTQVNSRLGTPDYMSPEQIRNPRDVDSRSDIYSFGCLFYELLTGWPPFDRGAGYETEHAVQAAHVNEPPIPPIQRRSTLPVELDRITLHCLAKAKEDRPQSCEEISATLNAYRVSLAQQQQAYRTAAVPSPLKSPTGPGSSGIAERSETVAPPPSYPPQAMPPVPAYSIKEPPPIPSPAIPAPAKPTAAASGPGFGQSSRTPTVLDTPVLTPQAPQVSQLSQVRVEPVKITVPSTPPIVLDNKKDGSKKSSQKLLIAFGSVLLLAALGGGGWVVFHKPEPTPAVDPNKDSEKAKVDDGTKPHDDSKVTPPVIPAPDEKPKPQPDPGKIIVPGPGGKIDPQKNVPVIPLPVPHKQRPTTPASGEFSWTGNITSPAQHMVTIYLSNRSAYPGTIDAAPPAAQPISITIGSGNAQVLAQPELRTNYSTFRIYVPGDGQQTVSIKWKALPVVDQQPVSSN